MTSRRGALSRRTFLRGALQGGGVAVLGLPLLDAMLDPNGEALAAGAPLPKRFVSWFFGNGVNLDQFEPSTTGPGYTLSPILQDLADVKDYLTVCTGLHNRGRVIQTHHEGLTAFSGYDQIKFSAPKISSDYGGPTIDQVVADRLEGSTAIHSLQFQVTKGFSTEDGGATSLHVSAQGTPGSLTFKAGESNPRRIWTSLFGAAPGPTGVRSSMFDFVRQDITNIRSRLGMADQRRLEAHLTGLRELEQIIAVSCPLQPGEPMEENLLPTPFEPVASVNSIMASLLAVCFACDLTRVASVLFLPLAGEVTLGVDVQNTAGTNHHMWSHNQTGTGIDGQNAYDQNVRYIMNRFGDWMRALKSQVEPNGSTLLDSTILFASSDCANGNHQINRQPVLLGGHGRGHLVYPGTHFQAIAGDTTLGTLNSYSQPAARSTSDVLLTCLNAFDPAATSVGDLTISPDFPSKPPPGSTTPLTEIEA